jgi:transcriptional repressor NrdR
MRCPFCSNEDTQVKDSRPADDNSSIRRRRQCTVCGARVTTFERVQLRELTVIKRNGEKSIYDRNKVDYSMRLALRKRKISDDVIDRAVNGISRSLESKGDAEIPSSLIGEQVMDALRQIDQIGYVRYASVYRNFSEAADFQKFLGQELDK